VFRKPGEVSEEDEEGTEGDAAGTILTEALGDEDADSPVVEAPKIVDEPRITIHEDD